MDKEWYEIRDIFFGQNYKQPDCLKAIQFAKDCKHPEAVYLYNTLKSAKSESDVIKLLYFGDLKARWYREFLLGYPSFYITDYPFSAALSGNDDLMKKAAESNEREAFYQLGLRHFRRIARAKYYYEKASELGCRRSMEELAWMCDFNDPKRWKLLFKAGGRCVAKTLRRGTLENSQCKFIVGKFLKDAPYFRKGEKKEYVDFYHFQCRATREAVDTFSLICIRLGIYRDLRILIGRYIWKTRKESPFI